MSRTNRPLFTRVAWSVGVVVALGVGFLAGRATFEPPRVAEDVLPTAMFTVVEGSVGSSVTLPVTASWTVTIAFSASAGQTLRIAVFEHSRFELNCNNAPQTVAFVG